MIILHIFPPLKTLFGFLDIPEIKINLKKYMHTTQKADK
jgi:hypothetical protein